MERSQLQGAVPVSVSRGGLSGEVLTKTEARQSEDGRLPR